MLTENIDLLHTVAAALLERETLTREDIEMLARGENAAAAHERLPPAHADPAPRRRRRPVHRAAPQPAAPRRTGAVAGVSGEMRSIE